MLHLAYTHTVEQARDRVVTALSGWKWNAPPSINHGSWPTSTFRFEFSGLLAEGGLRFGFALVDSTGYVSVMVQSNRGESFHLPADSNQLSFWRGETRCAVVDNASGMKQ